jgi:hypothetical protein
MNQKLLFKREINIDINIIITIKLRILEILVLPRRSNNLPLPIRASSHNHGEEQRKPIQSMDSKTHHGTISTPPKLDINTTITTMLKLKILEILVLMSLSNNLPQPIRVSSQNHGEEQRKLTHAMDSRMHHGNG